MSQTFTPEQRAALNDHLTDEQINTIEAALLKEEWDVVVAGKIEFNDLPGDKTDVYDAVEQALTEALRRLDTKFGLCTLDGINDLDVELTVHQTFTVEASNRNHAISLAFKEASHDMMADLRCLNASRR